MIRNYRRLARQAARVAEDKKAFSISIRDVRELPGIPEYLLILSCDNPVHLEAVAGILHDYFKKENLSVKSWEGREARSWILLDYGALVIHLFLADIRRFYDFDRLWEAGKKVPFAEAVKKDESKN